MSEPLLAFREVDVFYGVIQALKQVSLRIEPAGPLCIANLLHILA